ncbi:TolC family protein [Comamonas thiooxydans]|uniref:TolC family protein n=1 Tax=Comamonas thiooxydans TaxID=363952 RepID=A0AA42PZZ3_9BURK|nr:TolC family protein [Comamonas thiooxydans]MDH1334615.1 TolC family protein [Comamonas thiooxydans]MDH1740940.1 TolC family protein [Comamonas thiooxydans]MDH1787133.1 TolC family protein [Comamonas thiooxydans]
MPETSSLSHHVRLKPLLLGALSLATITLIGCASVPPSTLSAKPTVDVPQQWSTLAQGEAIVSAEWWKDFHNSELDQLVRSALDANRDLHTAAARLEQARALVGSAQAERLPQVGMTAGAQRGRDSAGTDKLERSTAGLQASWEIDLFGRAALGVNAAQANVLSSEQALSAARIALAADVATAYFELRTLDSRIALMQEAITLADRQLHMAQRKFDAGQSTALDVDRWTAELAKERATAQQLQGELQVRQRQLAVLLGTSQTPTLNLQAPTMMPQAPSALLPADLLERRPDVQRQARALDAALARVGMARREIYPRLQIGWAGSRERLAAIGGSASPMSVIGYGISLSMPILDGGRIRSNVQVHEAQAKEAMAGYEQAMITALAEVETSLARSSTSEASLRELMRAQEAGDTAAQRASRLFAAGMTDASAVLDTLRENLRVRDAVAQAEGERWASAVKLRRVFAGAV